MKHKDIDQAMAAKERAELYFAANPRSPAAMRRPELSIRSGKWVALLGRSKADGIVGVGWTVETALRAFDAQYVAASRPPVEAQVHTTPEANPGTPKDKKGKITTQKVAKWVTSGFGSSPNRFPYSGDFSVRAWTRDFERRPWIEHEYPPIES